jgi:hypothetical protein
MKVLYLPRYLRYSPLRWCLAADDGKLAMSARPENGDSGLIIRWGDTQHAFQKLAPAAGGGLEVGHRGVAGISCGNGGTAPP